MPEPVITKQNVRMRPKAGGNVSSGKPRPKTIHVDKSDLGSRSRPGSMIRLAGWSSLKSFLLHLAAVPCSLLLAVPNQITYFFKWSGVNWEEGEDYFHPSSLPLIF